MSKALSLDQIKARLTKLKNIGVAPSTKLKSNSAKVSDADKKKINRAFSEYKNVALMPEKDYKAVNISNLSTTKKKIMKDMGYQIKGNKAFVPMDENTQKVSLVNKWVKDSEGNHYVKTELIHSSENGRKKILDVIADPRRMKRMRDESLQEFTRRRLTAEYQNVSKDFGAKDKHTFIAVRINNNGIFTRDIYANINMLVNYAVNYFDDDPDKQWLMEKMHISLIEIKEPKDMGYGRKTENEKKARYNEVKRAKRATGTKNVKKKRKGLAGEVKRK